MSQDDHIADLESRLTAIQGQLDTLAFWLRHKFGGDPEFPHIIFERQDSQTEGIHDEGLFNGEGTMDIMTDEVECKPEIENYTEPEHDDRVRFHIVDIDTILGGNAEVSNYNGGVEDRKDFDKDPTSVPAPVTIQHKTKPHASAFAGAGAEYENAQNGAEYENAQNGAEYDGEMPEYKIEILEDHSSTNLANFNSNQEEMDKPCASSILYNSLGATSSQHSGAPALHGNISILINDDIGEVSPTYQCEYCKAVFQDESLTEYHKFCVRGLKLFKTSYYPFPCHYCTARWGSLAEFLNHVEIHLHTDRPYMCNFCNSSFRSHWTLRKHSAKHTKVFSKNKYK